MTHGLLPFCVQVAMRCGVPATHVKNVIIWGNHSSTQYPDVHHCVVKMSGSELACFDAIKDEAWLKGEFITVSYVHFPCHDLAGVWRTLNICVWKSDTQKKIQTRIQNCYTLEYPLFYFVGTLCLLAATFFMSLACRLCSREALQSSKRGSCPALCLLPRPFVTTWEISGPGPLRWMPLLHFFFFSDCFYMSEVQTFITLSWYDVACIYILLLPLLGWICFHGCLLYWQLLWSPGWPHLFIPCPNSPGKADLSLCTHEGVLHHLAINLIVSDTHVWNAVKFQAHKNSFNSCCFHRTSPGRLLMACPSMTSPKQRWRPQQRSWWRREIQLWLSWEYD